MATPETTLTVEQEVDAILAVNEFWRRKLAEDGLYKRLFPLPLAVGECDAVDEGRVPLDRQRDLSQDHAAD